MTPSELADHIKGLNALELRELRDLLGWDEPDAQAGVREPRRPSPDAGEAGWPEPAPLPADYWETAQ